jgi:hypothetical protein
MRSEAGSNQMVMRMCGDGRLRRLDGFAKGTVWATEMEDHLATKAPAGLYQRKRRIFVEAGPLLRARMLRDNAAE